MYVNVILRGSSSWIIRENSKWMILDVFPSFYVSGRFRFRVCKVLNGVGVWEGAPSWLFVFCWGAAYINPLTVISIVEAVRARKGSVFIHTVSCSHWVSTHSNHMAELDWRLPTLRIFPDIFAIRSQQWTYQWLTLIVFVIYFPFCNINRGSWNVGSFHAPWQFQNNIGALGITESDEDQWIVMNQLWDVRTWYCSERSFIPWKFKVLAPFQVQDFWTINSYPANLVIKRVEMLVITLLQLEKNMTAVCRWQKITIFELVSCYTWFDQPNQPIGSTQSTVVFPAKMEENRLTSWGWSFISLFTRFYVLCIPGGGAGFFPVHQPYVKLVLVSWWFRGRSPPSIVRLVWFEKRGGLP